MRKSKLFCTKIFNLLNICTKLAYLSSRCFHIFLIRRSCYNSNVSAIAIHLQLCPSREWLKCLEISESIMEKDKYLSSEIFSLEIETILMV